jgi:glutamate racemase
MTIGVFDSGIGGKSVALAIERALPEHNVVFRDDSTHLPYGTKSIDEIRSFVTPILLDMATQCDAIVVACNTVSTNLIDELESEVPVPLIATVPMLETAARITKTKVIAVCATPRTLGSKLYNQLKARYAHSIRVLEPDCSDWTSLIEANQMNQSRIQTEVDNLCLSGADVIVLGCTHYHWIEHDIRRASRKRAKILQPEESIIAELKIVLERLP